MDCYNTFLISHLTMGSYIDSYLYFTFHLNNINIKCLLNLSLEKKPHKRMGFKMTLDIFICLHMGWWYMNIVFVFCQKHFLQAYARQVINIWRRTSNKWEKNENLYMYSWLYHITCNVCSILNELITTLFNFELVAGCVIARNWQIICYNINMIM